MIPHDPNRGSAPQRRPHERAQPGGQRFHAGPAPVRHLGTGGSAAESRPRPHMGMLAAGRAISTWYGGPVS